METRIKRLLRKPELSSILMGFEASLQTPIAIYSAEGLCLWGKEQEFARETPVVIGDCDPLWLRSNRDIDLVAQTFQYIIAQEFDKKSLANELLQKYEEINFLYEIGEKISSCLSIREVVQLVVNEIKKVMEFDGLSLLLLNSKGELTVQFSTQSDRDRVLSTLTDVAGYVLKTGKAEIVDDLSADSRYLAGHPPLGSMICAPLTVQNQTFGIISLSHHQTHYYNTEDLKLFTTLLSQAAAAIQTVQYYERLKDYSQTLAQKVTERTQELERANQQLERANQDLERMATIDELTGIANRRHFNQSFYDEWRRLSRDRNFLALLLIDVDYFKDYNDYYGHQAGDECLKQIAQTMKKLIQRPSDLVARYGGEEFTVILANTNYLGAQKVAEKIRLAVQSLQIPHQQSQVSPYVTLSVGIASMMPTLNQSPEILIKAADKALYEAKEMGRNCCQTQIFH